MHEEQEHEDLTVHLAPAGETPFNHVASLHDGCLTLEWLRGTEHAGIRTFTERETKTLLVFLADNRAEIFQVEPQR